MLTRLIFVSMVITAAFGAAVKPKSEKAAPYCNTQTCIEPNCRCSLTTIPGDLAPTDTPQIILLTFDDAVNVLNYDYYQRLIFNRINPNGCPVQATYFLSHEYNNYTLVNSLYNKKHEIATHSITHRTNSTFWSLASPEDWESEMIDMITMIERYAQVPRSAIKGARAPFLLMGGNEMYTAYQRNGLQWDCTWSTRNYMDPGLWPYTLDYRSYQECPVGRCPDESFPGMWVVPMIDLTDSVGNPCAMLDTCNMGTTREAVKKTLLDNFQLHYRGNRSPFGLFLHASWLQTSSAFYDGYKDFLDEMQNYDDVYFVTISQLIEWVKSPTKWQELQNFTPWACQAETASCREQRCTYEPDKTPFGSERIMSMCSGNQCPFFYPWYSNIMGANPPTPFP